MLLLFLFVVLIFKVPLEIQDEEDKRDSEENVGEGGRGAEIVHESGNGGWGFLPFFDPLLC